MTKSLQLKKSAYLLSSRVSDMRHNSAVSHEILSAGYLRRAKGRCNYGSKVNYTGTIGYKLALNDTLVSLSYSVRR